jgi:hypothetical protein
MRRLILLAATLLLVQPALAQADRHSLALRVVAAGFEPQIASRIMETYWPVATELIKLRVPKPTEIQLFQYKGKTGGFAREAARATMAPMVELFERDFTEEELEALIAFYESPAGTKLNLAAAAIAAAMAGPVTANLAGEITAFQAKIDAMLAADGY